MSAAPLVVNPGGTVRISVFALQWCDPDQTAVTAVLRPGDITLASFEPSWGWWGDPPVSLTIPAGLAPGNYSVVLLGRDLGRPVSLSAGITVTDGQPCPLLDPPVDPRSGTLAVVPQAVPVGGVIRVQASIATCGLTYRVVLEPGAVELSAAVAGADNALDVSITLPKEIGPGEYTIKVLQPGDFSTWDPGGITVTPASNGSALPRAATDVPPTGRDWPAAAGTVAAAFAAVALGAAAARRRRAAR
jgi:hypothetical protein